MQIENLVLGAGISGLAAANVLSKSNTIVFEKENFYGGLCNSFNIGKFTFDTAIHLSFTNNESVKEELYKIQYNSYSPMPYNYYHGIWMKHPVINNLYKLPIKEKVQCLKGFIEKPEFEKIKNYNQWLISAYGNQVVDRFYEEYTKKYWCKESKELSVTWVGERLSLPELEKVLNGAFEENENVEYYAKTMRYPKEGGYKGFLKNIYENSTVYFNKEAVKINTKEKCVYFKDGTFCFYKNLISSVPIKEMVKILDNVPLMVKRAGERLLCTSVIIVSVGFNKPYIPKHLWFYIYDEDILPARVYSPSLKSSNNVPVGCSSMQFEIYYTDEKPIKNKEHVLKHVKDCILKMKLCNEEDILFMDEREIKYGNVVFYNNMEEDRDIVKEYLSKEGIQLIGRFGTWDYLWSDQSYLSGKSAGEKFKIVY